MTPTESRTFWRSIADTIAATLDVGEEPSRDDVRDLLCVLKGLHDAQFAPDREPPQPWGGRATFFRQPCPPPVRLPANVVAFRRGGL